MDFERRFEGRDTLEELLGIAGSPFTMQQVVDAMREAVAEKKAASELIPTLFEGEPRFSNPDVARRLYQNLLGLWDLVAAGQPFDHEGAKAPPPRVKKPKPQPPPPFTDEPDEAFVEAAWRYLEDDRKERVRLNDKFENVQDALLSWLDAEGLSDEGYASARQVIFELFSMIELGWPGGTSSAAPPGAGATEGAAEPPAALMAYADEAIFEAEQDDESPLAADEGKKVRELVTAGARALWKARKPK
jgi:hypothetical protein